MKRCDELRHILLELDPKQSPEAVAFFESMEKGSELSAFELATALVKCDTAREMPRILFDFIVGLYEEAIADGSSDAMNDLGVLYYDGRGCEQDYAKAFRYYKKAAKLGHRRAQENLGYCYYYGRSVPIDYEKAFRYFALGAFEGATVSLYKIGDMYMNGYYVEKNPTEAFRIYTKCLECLPERISQDAAGPVLLRLGNCFLNGIGVDPNPKTALFAFQKAENYLREMISAGNVRYESSLQAAIDGQAKAREKLQDKPPKNGKRGGKKD